MGLLEIRWLAAARKYAPRILVRAGKLGIRIRASALRRGRCFVFSRFVMTDLWGIPLLAIVRRRRRPSLVLGTTFRVFLPFFFLFLSLLWVIGLGGEEGIISSDHHFQFFFGALQTAQVEMLTALLLVEGLMFSLLLSELVEGLLYFLLMFQLFWLYGT